MGKGLNILTINRRKGVLIVYEGISGCGKSEGIRRILHKLAEAGYTANVVEWNSNHIIRGLIKCLASKEILTPGIYSLLQWISFFIDYVVKIKPCLNRGNIVIADRYVYTGLTRDKVNCNRRNFSHFSHWIIQLIRKPDILLFFDIEPQICYERVKLRGKPLFHTNKKILRNSLLKNKELYYLRKLRAEYLKLMNDTRLFKSTKVFIVNNNFELLDQSIMEYLRKKFT